MKSDKEHVAKRKQEHACASHVENQMSGGGTLRVSTVTQTQPNALSLGQNLNTLKGFLLCLG